MKSKPETQLSLIVLSYQGYMNAVSKLRKVKLELESLSPNETQKFSELAKELEGLEKESEIELAGVLSSIHHATILTY